MTPEARMLLGLFLASVLAYAATPVAVRVAGRLEFFDKPVGYKGHAAPTPYLGGAAVMAAFVATVLVLAGDYGRTVPLVIGVAVLWAVGTVDDRRNVSPGLRVLVELALAAGLWALDLGWDLGVGSGVDLAVTVLWVVAVINAFNLFDNMDGASSTMALVVAAAVAALGVVEGDAWLAAVGAALAGACIGFLPHNLARPGARIFLGDGGSMPLGFAIAAIAMIGTSGVLPAWQALVASLVLVGLPLVDTTLVIVSRTRKGISILTGGRDHMTHRTRRQLRDARAVAAALGGVQAVVSVLALLAINGGSVALVFVVLTFLVAAGTAIALFEAQETRLITADSRPAEAGGAIPAREPGTRARSTVGATVLVLVALGASLSPFGAGYYDSAIWVPVGLALVTVVAAGVIARPPRLDTGAVLVLAGLGLGFWQLLSATWAESAQQAVLEGNRTLVLAAVVGVGLVVVRSERRAVLLVVTLAAGTTAVAASVTLRMLSGDLGNLFLSGRLDQPLGYINAQATVFVLGLWLSFAAIERRRPALAGAGAALGTLFACLIVLSQSRGAALAVLVSVAVVVLLVPGRVRRIYALAAIGLGVAVAGGPLLDVYDAFVGDRAIGGPAQDAIRAALLSSVAVGLAWAAATAAHAAVRNPGDQRDVRRVGAGVLAAVGLVVLVVGMANAGRIADRASQQYQAFTRSEPTGSIVPSSTSSRLVSGAGNRYEYWRVSWDAFKDAPVVGVGAGGFDVPYFRERTITEDVRQPHSIELQALSETGVVGGALLLVLLLGLAFGARRSAQASRQDDLARATTVAAVGGLTAWLAHTSVDWQHLLPGVSAVALLLGTVLLRRRAPSPGPRAGPARRAARPRQVAVAVGLGVALVITGASLGRQGLSEFFQDRARAALSDDPARALTEADRSLRLDGDAVPTYYVKAAAQARFGRGADAESTLLQAAAKEPTDFVTWALLGDLAVRRGQLDRAGAYYERGAALNPRDLSLRELVDDPRRALG